MEKLLEELKQELARHGMTDVKVSAGHIEGLPDAVNEDVVSIESQWGKGNFLGRLSAEILRLNPVGVKPELLWEKLGFCKLNPGQKPEDWSPQYVHAREKAPEPLTVEKVREWVERIRLEAMGDSERAHGSEDTLYEEVLKAVAAGEPNAAEMAREALATKSIEFNRWGA